VAGAAALALAISGSAAAQEDDASRPGPFEWRETWLLTQPRLTLAPVSPDTLGKGVTVARAGFDWGNDLGWNQTREGEDPLDRRFLVDGEHRSIGLEIRHGLGERVDVGMRLPIEWRGGGIIDGVIDWFHGFTRRLGLPDNGRSSFDTGLLRVLGRDASGRALDWNPEGGTGLGRLELLLRFGLRQAPPSCGTRVALVARVGLPTGTGPFETTGLAAGGQMVAARSVGTAWDLFVGVGGAVEGDPETGDVRYRRSRGYGFMTAERRFGRRWSAVAQTAAASRLVTNLARYPGLEMYLSLGARLNLDSGTTIEAGFTENIANQQATTDFGIQIGVSQRFGRQP
jgi:hypothetical protein